MTELQVRRQPPLRLRYCDERAEDLPDLYADKPAHKSLYRLAAWALLNDDEIPGRSDFFRGLFESWLLFRAGRRRNHDIPIRTLELVEELGSVRLAANQLGVGPRAVQKRQRAALQSLTETPEWWCDYPEQAGVYVPAWALEDPQCLSAPDLVRLDASAEVRRIVETARAEGANRIERLVATRALLWPDSNPRIARWRRIFRDVIDEHLRSVDDAELEQLTTEAIGRLFNKVVDHLERHGFPPVKEVLVDERSCRAALIVSNGTVLAEDDRAPDVLGGWDVLVLTEDELTEDDEPVGRERSEPAVH